MKNNKQTMANKYNKFFYVLRFIGLYLITMIKRKLRPRVPFLQSPYPLSPEGFSAAKILELLPEASQIKDVKVEPIFLHQYEADKAKNIMGIAIKYPTKTVKAVIKFSKPLQPKLNVFINAANLGHCREKLFYEQISHQLPISTPQYINGYADKISGDYFVILHRIENARIIADHENCPLAESCFALEQIAKVHALPLNQMGSLEWIVGDSNDRPFRWMVVFFKKYFDESYINLVNKLCDYINLLPASFVHIDFRPGNIFFKYDALGKVNDMILYDWNAPTISTGIYDVVYFMVSGMDPDVRRLHYDTLVDTYLNQLAKSGITCNKDQFNVDFQVVALLLFAMSAGHKKIGLFDDWNVANMQWDNWENKGNTLSQDFNFDLLSKKLNMDKQNLKLIVQDICKK